MAADADGGDDGGAGAVLRHDGGTVARVAERLDGPSGPVEVTRWTLVRGSLEVEVLSLGARLHRVRLAHGATHHDLLAGPTDPAGHLAPDALPYAGATVGRYANRLGGGRLTVDGVVHVLATNEGTTTLHGGPDGFDRRDWDVRDTSDERGPGVTCTLVSPDGDQGFPGELVARADYRLLDGGRLAITYEARCDAPTVVALTNHAYVDLGGAGDVRDHVLRVDADRVVLVDDDGLPTAVVPVDGTRFDLREPARVGSVAARGTLDHCLLLAPGGGARLSHPPSGRFAELATDAPGVQVFLTQPFDPPLRGVALEPGWPADSPAHDWLPDVVLRPGEVRRTTSTWRFGVD